MKYLVHINLLLFIFLQNESFIQEKESEKKTRNYVKAIKTESSHEIKYSQSSTRVHFSSRKYVLKTIEKLNS